MTNRVPALALFFVSGALALAYQVVWTRYLVLLLGASTPVVSIVIGVFMAGLALGARLIGGVADRHPAPMKLYGLLEAGIGAYALALPAVIHGVTPTYLRLAQATGEEPLFLALLRIGTGFLLLGPATVMMGGTLPALLKVVARDHSRLGRDLGVLYAANLLGAVCGTLSSAFLWIALLGMRGTVALAALGNLLVALFAYLWPAPAPGVALAPSSHPHDVADGRPGGRIPAHVLLVVIGLSGLFTMAYEVLWTRILLFTFWSTVHAFAVILAVFLLGLTLGSFAVAFAERRHPLGAGALAAAQIGAGLLALGLAPMSASIRELILRISRHLGFTGEIYVLGMAMGAAALMLAPATLMGVVFPLASRLSIADLSRSGGTMGRAYWINTVGAVAGSLLAGFVLIPLLGLKGSLMLVAAVQVLAGWLCLLWAPLPPRRRFGLGAASAVAVGVAFAMLSRVLAGPSPFDRDLGGATLVAHRDDNTASVSVVAGPSGRRTLRIDGFVAATAEQGAGYMAMMSHIPMLLHPHPERALVVCFGTGTTAGGILRYPDTKLDVVDINATVFRFADLFVEVNHGVARDPRARLRVDDGRSFLQTTAERYDVITSEPMPPTFAGVVNLYSREYYQLAWTRLRPGGLLVQWLPFHLVTADQAWSILRSVQDVFPETTLWLHENTGIIVARREQPIVIDVGGLRERVASVREDLRQVAVPDLGAFIELYGLGPAAVADLTRRAGAVTDDRPSLEFHSPQHRWQPMWGAFTPSQLEALVAVYTRRAREPLPLTEPLTEEGRALAAARVGSSYALLGDAYLGAGRGGLARGIYEEGFARAGPPAQRAGFLFALAQIAEKEGRGREAVELVDRGLVLSPENAAARRFRAQLTENPAPN